MVKVRIKGYEFEAIIVKDSCNRRALQFKNNIINTLKKIGLTEDDVDIPLEALAMKRCPASATWYMMNRRLHYSSKTQLKFVDNLYVVSKIIEFEVNALLNKEKEVQDFLNDFSEDKDVEDQRKEARETLGLTHDELNLEVIDKAYKTLAREHHPDKDGGNVDMFKKINHAHKILKRELG